MIIITCVYYHLRIHYHGHHMKMMSSLKAEAVFNVNGKELYDKIEDFKKDFLGDSQ